MGDTIVTNLVVWGLMQKDGNAYDVVSSVHPIKTNT